MEILSLSMTRILFLFYFEEELDCVPSVEETFSSARQSDGIAFSSTFGEAYFYLYDFESNIEFDEDLEHLVGVNEGGHSNVANVGQRNF